VKSNCLNRQVLRTMKGTLAEESKLVGLFSGFVQNMCKIVTEILVESYKVHVMYDFFCAVKVFLYCTYFILGDLLNKNNVLTIVDYKTKGNNNGCSCSKIWRKFT